MIVPEKRDLARLRQAQHALGQLVAEGFDQDGSHAAALSEIDRTITAMVAAKWRGQSIRSVGHDRFMETDFAA